MSIFPSNQGQPANPHSRYMGEELMSNEFPSNTFPKQSTNTVNQHTHQKSIFSNPNPNMNSPQPYNYTPQYSDPINLNIPTTLSQNNSYVQKSRLDTEQRNSNVKGFNNPMGANNGIFGGQRSSVTNIGQTSQSQIIGRPSNELPPPIPTKRQNEYQPKLAESNILEQVIGFVTQQEPNPHDYIQKRSTVVKSDIISNLPVTQTVPYFVNKRVVVTGASSGIGRAVAAWMLNSGALVALIGRDLEALINLGKQFPKQALVIRCDLSKDDQPYDMASTVLKEFGGLDFLINCAGMLVDGDIKRTFPHDYDYMMDVNVRSVFYLSYLFHQQLVQSKGCIVNVSGMFGNKPFAGLYAYCMSKAGVETLTKQLAHEFAPQGVRVNCVSPGLTDSNFLIYRKLPKGEIEEIYQNSAYFNPLKRIGSVDDVAKAIIFLCSPAAFHVTGKILKVDGGRTLTSSGWHEWWGSKYTDPLLESDDGAIEKVKNFFIPKKMVYLSPADKIETLLKQTNWSTTEKSAHATVKNAEYKTGDGRFDPIESVINVEKAYQRMSYKG